MTQNVTVSFATQLIFACLCLIFRPEPGNRSTIIVSALDNGTMGSGVGRRMLLLGAVAWLASMGSPASVAADSTARAGGKLQG